MKPTMGYLLKEHSNWLHVIAYLQSSDDIMSLCLLKDILDRSCGKIFYYLTIPFLSYSRQDRPISNDVPFSLKAFSKILNSLEFDHVRTHELHSDVPYGTINNLQQYEVDIPISLVSASDAFVSPDAGAFKKVSKLGVRYNKPVITALKVRNTTNGDILESKILDETVPNTVSIIDDICDGGATFIPLAKALKERGAKTVNLYVTHGIFSKGFDALREHIDHIYTTDTFIHEEELPSDFVTVERIV